jgi:hypothetical protein
MPGTDHILSKAFVVASNVSTAISLGQALVMATNVQVPSIGQPAQVAPAGIGGNVFCIGVAAENVDLAKIATGKAFIAVNVLGIAKVIADGAIAIGAPVMNSTTTAGFVKPGATAGSFLIGYALEAAAASGDIIDVLLTPGAKF